MKIIVHAPSYMVGRAADIAARQFHEGALENNSLIGIISGEHCFTIKRNKGGLSVWHFLRPDGAPNPDKLEAA
jgi:hypothetical protein